MRRTIIYLILLVILGQKSYGQTITGIVKVEKNSPMCFVEIFILDSNSIGAKTIADFDGLFIFKQEININKAKLKVYGKFGGCSTDTVNLTKKNAKKIRLTLILPDSVKSKCIITNCRNDYIRKDNYYFDFSELSSDTILILKGAQILQKKTYSPYDYQIIEKNKNYKSGYGHIYKGKKIIKLKKLPLKEWDEASFEPIEEIN